MAHSPPALWTCCSDCIGTSRRSPQRCRRPASGFEVVDDAGDLAPDARGVHHAAAVFRALTVAALGPLAHRFVEAIPRAADGESLLVQKLADAPNEQHFVVLVIPTVAAPLDRLQLREL